MNRLHFSAPMSESFPLDDLGAELPISLFEDVLNASLLTATAASIATSISTNQPSSLPHTALVLCLPPIPISYPAVVAQLEHRPRDQRLLTALRDFIEALLGAREFAQLVSLSSFHDRDSLPTGATLLAADWRRTALLGLTLVDRLQSAFAGRLLEPLLSRTKLAVDLLAAVCRGESPCVSKSGRVILPEPFERRSAPRSKTARHASFALRDGIHSALVLNVSRQGIGICGLSGLECGDAITLLAGPGQHATGKIAWLEQDRAGVRFDRPLPDAIVRLLTD